MEKRAFTRQLLEHDAQFSNQYHQPEACKVKDFCKGGLFITYAYQEGELLHTPVRPYQMGDAVSISYKSAKPLPLTYKLETTVMRVMDGAMGLAITQSNPEAIHALYSIAKAQPQPTKTKEPQTASEHQQVMAKCRQLVHGFLNAGSKRIFEKINDHLMLQASHAANNTEEREYFDAITKFNKHQTKISKAFITSALTQIDNWIAGQEVVLPEPSKDVLNGRLSLIEKDDFEDWLIVKVIATKAEQRFKEELFNLQKRMSEISSQQINPSNNPTSPTHICHAFYQAIHPMALNKDMAESVFDTFEEHIVRHLESLYQKMNEMLAENGILPEIIFLAEKSQEQDDSRHEKATAEKANEQNSADVIKPVQDKEPQAYLTPQPEPAKPDNVIPLPTTAKTNFVEKQQEVPKPLPSNSMGNFHDQQGMAKDAFETVQNLLKLQNQLVATKKSNSNPESLEEPVTPKANYASDFILSNLTKLQTIAPDELSDIDSSASLNERLSTFLGDDDKQFSEEDTTTIDVTDNFFQAMLANQALTKVMKPSIKQLEIPLLKILLKDDSFFENDEHPARLVLNSLAKLGSKGGHLNKANEKNVAHIIERIKKEFDQDTHVFDEVLPALEQLVNKQEHIAQRNAERVIESCEGLQTLDKAKKQVITFINEQTHEKWVPKVLIDFLDQGWRELLVFCILRDGNKSAIWKSYSRVVEKLALFSPDVKNNEDLIKQGPGILKMIETGIKDAPTGQQQLRKLLPALQHLLVPEINSPEPIFIEVDKNTITPDIAFSALDDEEVQDKAFVRWIKRAKRLKISDWIEFSAGDDALQMRLAWIDDNHQKLVFVNHQGMKVIEFSLKELAEHLQSGNAHVLKNHDQPFVDQNLDQMVQNMYEQMNYQATHDDVTGLINRKEFERHTDNALLVARSKRKSHTLLQLNLDQFKVVNNACGHDGGNLLLKEISGLLAEHSKENSLLAHIGGDEFAIILNDCDEQEAKVIAKHHMARIQDHRFIWDEKTYTVGVSIGIVTINEGMEDSSQVIKALDSACISAKDAGRNRIYIYQPNDQDEAKRSKVIDKMAMLNKALDEERLQLRCQKIAPIHSDMPVKPHYEVLLSVNDEHGLQLAPTDFILAAERYNRMQDVDRWVINHTFKWISENQQKLDDIEGFTINLSGHSLNDEGLIGFIFEELVQTDIPRDKICFEITETTAVLNLSDAADFISEMKNLGFKFALDDFGTGLSSYKYLKALPVDYLKIDGSFIKNLDTDINDFAMVKSINDMAHLMGKKTVAEYVENDEILERLREIGVDYAQGYGIEKPMLLNNVCERAA